MGRDLTQHDPKIDNNNLGSLDDTAVVPGLANLTACLLLRGGTASHPQPDSFMEFLGQHSGDMYAANVGMRQHSFTFQVGSSALGAALKR